MNLRHFIWILFPQRVVIYDFCFDLRKSWLFEERLLRLLRFLSFKVNRLLYFDVFITTTFRGPIRNYDSINLGALTLGLPTNFRMQNQHVPYREAVSVMCHYFKMHDHLVAPILRGITSDQSLSMTSKCTKIQVSMH